MVSKPMPRQSTRHVLETVLSETACSSHKQVQAQLEKRGVRITQASISRMLNRMGAIKTHTPEGTPAYRLHKGTVIYRGQNGTGQGTPAAPKLARPAIASHMVERVIANDSLFVVLTKPDCARYIGTFIDDAALPSVAGTLAGGNTVLVLPMSAKLYPQARADLRLLFPAANHTG